VESGGSNAGGTMSGAGGQSSGGDSGGSLGGVLGQGGSGGLLGSGGASGRSFPTTKVLDQFERDDGAVGANWVGTVDEYEIKDKALHHLTSAAPTLLWSTKFATQQEAFAKIVDFGDMAKEINLVLLAQDPESGCDYIELIYKPVIQELAVDYCFSGEWRNAGTFAMTLEKGDELGARIAADRRLLAYVNRKLATTFDISAYPMVDGGYIGVNSYENESATWDDFGGGNVR
jgi:beta-glucosidase